MKGATCIKTAHCSWIVLTRIWIMVLLLNGCARPAPPTEKVDSNKALVSMLDLDGKSVNPFQLTVNGKPIVFFFLSTDCPISNRYAPEIQRLAGEFSTNGVNICLIYPDPDTTAEAIRKHTNEYGYSIPVLRDPKHTLVKRAQVVVTPEAAVFLPSGKLVYSGRIDNRYLDFGKQRPAPTKRDLQEVLRALLRGDPISSQRQPAVGCSIASP